MNRRDFVRGMLIGTTASTALIQIATPEEVKALVVDQPVVVGPPTPPMHIPGWPDNPELYIRKGDDFLCVGYMTELNVSAGVEEVVSWGGSGVYVPTLRRATIKFRGSLD